MEKGTGKTIFFAFEAGGHTADMQTGEEVSLSLPETMETVLGKETWSKVDPEIKTKLESTTFGVVIEPAKTDKTQGTGNESRHTESDHAMIDYFADKVHKAMKAKVEWTNILMGAFGGGLLVYVAVNMHWLKVA